LPNHVFRSHPLTWAMIGFIVQVFNFNIYILIVGSTITLVSFFRLKDVNNSFKTGFYITLTQFVCLFAIIFSNYIWQEYIQIYHINVLFSSMLLISQLLAFYIGIKDYCERYDFPLISNSFMFSALLSTGLHFFHFYFASGFEGGVVIYFPVLILAIILHLNNFILISHVVNYSDLE